MWVSEVGTPACRAVTFIPVCKACWEMGAGECFWQHSEMDEQAQRGLDAWQASPALLLQAELGGTLSGRGIVEFGSNQA